MLAEQRYEAILAELELSRASSVAQLCEVTGASEATVRRDLNTLAKQGRLNKVHGGAVLAADKFEGCEADVVVKERLNREEKERIARYAATLISDDEVIFLDAGTTTLRMTDSLKGSRATFVTNGIECAHRLVSLGLRAYVVGGLLKPVTQAVVGTAALEWLSHFNFSKAFLGTNGITVRQGFTTPDPEEAAVKVRAAEQAYLTYVLADSSKFGKVAAAAMFPLEKACIITDDLPDPVYREHTVIKEV